MCTYKTTSLEKEVPCLINKIIKENLPEDEIGYCIFHSENLEWKSSNQFSTYLALLLTALKNIDEDVFIQLFGLHIFFQDEENTNEENSSVKTELLLNDISIKNSISLNECVFYNNLVLKNVSFEKSLTLNKCTFKEIVSFENCVFEEYVFFGENCVFKKEFYFENSTVDGPMQIDECEFQKSVDIETNTFTSIFWITKCNFTIDVGVVRIKNDFLDGFSFFKNSSHCLLTIAESNFHGESSIDHLSWETKLELGDCNFFNSFRFQGNSKKLMFNPETIIEVKPNQFHENSRIIFDHCDMLNLNDSFFKTFKKLMDEDRIKVLESCRLYPFKEIFIYGVRDLNDEIFYDFHTLVSRFFKRIFSLRLEVQFDRIIDSENFKVTYRSMENLGDEFLVKLQHVVDQLKLKSFTGNNDLDLQKKFFWVRIDEKYKRGEINQKEIKELLQYGGTIQINNLDQLKFLGKENQTLKISQVESLEIAQGNIYIQTLNNLENEPAFRLQDNQFEALKSELQNIKDVETWERLKKMLDRDEDAETKNNSITIFFLDTGIASGRAVIGGSILLVLHAILGV